MRFIIALFFLLPSITAYSQYWAIDTSISSSILLSDVYFTTPETGFACGYQNVFMKTNDGGTTWMSESVNQSYWDIEFLDTLLGFRCGDNGIVEKTTDGGFNWGNISPSTPNVMREIYFMNADTGWILSYNASTWLVSVFKTINGGSSWTSSSVGTTNTVHDIIFVNDTLGFIGGMGGARIWRTTDGGLNWFVTGLTGSSIAGIDFINDSTGIAVGNDGKIYRTTDFGISWNPITSGVANHFTSVQFADHQNGWIVGYGGIILYSSDGGLTWVQQASNTTFDIMNLYMFSNNYGWAVSFKQGYLGVEILKYGTYYHPRGILTGKIYGDVNANCISDIGDLDFQYKYIKITPGPYYGISDFSGTYTIPLPDTGTYTVSVELPDTLWQTSCISPYSVHLNSALDTISGVDFPLKASLYCPQLAVNLGAPILRRCFNNTYSINYLNTGTLPASNAYIEIDFGDYLQPQSSTIPWSTISGSIYTFPIGNININQQGSFNVTAYLDCAASLGSTQCVTAHIYPDSLCLPPPAGWDKSETAVSGTCVNDSIVCFTIKNRSAAGSGDMAGAAQWRLYGNDTLITQGTYQLAGQDSLIKCYPANGKTYRLEADQNLPHPRRSKPQAIVEACGSPTTFGFVNTVPQDDEELAVETFCMQVIGSFDPNDKQVSPIGITSNNYIAADDELEYLIRFQNTGTDTAFKVVIRDTIATDVLDIATLVSGASSHDYTFNIYGQGIAEWTFDNILLPDSFVNEPASHGFVQFKIQQLPGNPDGTLIENRAAIYFDFNAPVITNTAWNEVNEAEIPLSLLSASSISSDITCYGDSNGVAFVSATGGLPPYQFAWSNGATAATASNLFAGNYSITITDAAENVWTDSVSISEPALLQAAITSHTNVLCYANGTGTATASATGGTVPYSYEWSNTSGAQTATSLNAGVYAVTVWDAHLCTATTSSITITEPTQLTTTISTQSSVSCFGDNDAAAKANPVGGVSPYTAEWSDGQTGFTANNLFAGNYQVTVTDSNGCWLVTSVTIQDGYQVNTGNISGADSADINQTSIYGVNAGLNYIWSVNNGAIISGQGTNSVEVDWNATGQGTIQVIATDQGCADTVTKTITLVDPTGIEYDLLNGMELYPNPTNGTILLKEIPSLGEMESLVVLKLYDSIGKQLLKQTATPLELQQGILLDLSEMNEGVFFLSIKTEAVTRVMKVMKY